MANGKPQNLTDYITFAAEGGTDKSMTHPSWYPNEIFRLLYNLGHDNNLSYQEVAYMFLREALRDYGFDCTHKNIGFPKKPKPGQNKPYCKDCYSRLQIVQETGLLKGKIVRENQNVALETFVDRKRKEKLKALETERDEYIRTEVDRRFKALVDTAIKKEETGSSSSRGTQEDTSIV